jgi:hypothetical protein
LFYLFIYKLGLYDLPEGCEKEAAALIALPDGHQALDGIRRHFTFCPEKK